MITSFEVGAVFKLVNDGSPALRKILADVRALNKAIKEAQAQLGLTTKAMGTSMAPALAETKALAAEWAAVSRNAQGARASIASASRANAALATGNARNIIAPGGGGRGRNSGGSGGGRSSGGSGVHVSSIGGSIPGGHANFRGGGNAAMAGAGALAYGIYEEAVLQDQIFLMQFHAGMERSEKNSKYFRDLIQKTAANTGFGYKEIAEAATDEIRLMKGADGKSSGGLAILPEMLQAAATETRLKPGTTFKTAMESLIQGAHMAQEYGLEDIKGMAPLLAFLSTTNPATLPQMVRAAGYAMPSLHSQLNMNPADVLMDSTAIARAGATNTESGTWVESFYQRLLPPDRKLVSKNEYATRISAMQRMGLVDKDGKSLVLSGDGKTIDGDKAKQTVAEHSAAMGIVERAAVQQKAFGKQGARGAALLTNPKVLEQSNELRKEYPDFKNQYGTFMQDYSANSPIQKTRETMQELTNVLADIGGVALPPVTQALRDFSDVLKTIKGILPDSGKEKDKDGVWGRVGAGAIKGGALGAFFGSVIPGAGTVSGGAIGGALGGGAAVITEMSGASEKLNATATPTVGVLENLANAISGLAAAAREGMKFGGAQTGGAAVPAPPSGGGEKHGSIYMDGRKVGSLITRGMADRMSGPTEGSPFHDSTHGAPSSDLAWSTG